jgi:hypothetical protein
MSMSAIGIFQQLPNNREQVGYELSHFRSAGADGTPLGVPRMKIVVTRSQARQMGLQWVPFSMSKRKF